MTGFNHLTEKDFIIAAVDQADLSTEARAHLADCPACAGELAQLNAGLEGLSGLAREMVPPARTRFSLPERAGLLPGWFHRPLTIAAGAAATVAVALTIWLSYPLEGSGPNPVTSVKAVNLAAIEETAPLITMAGFEDRATLSDFHLFVAGGDENLEENANGDGFIDQLAPAIESI